MDVDGLLLITTDLVFSTTLFSKLVLSFLLWRIFCRTLLANCSTLKISSASILSATPKSCGLVFIKPHVLQHLSPCQYVQKSIFLLLSLLLFFSYLCFSSSLSVLLFSFFFLPPCCCLLLCCCCCVVLVKNGK